MASEATFEEDNQFFKQLQDMIPTAYMLNDDLIRRIHGGEGDDHTQWKEKTLDRLRRKTVSEIQEELTEKADVLSLTKKQRKRQKNAQLVNRNMTQNIETLRQRLHQRIAELSGKKTQLSPEDFAERTHLKKKDKQLRQQLRKSQKQNHQKGMVTAIKVGGNDPNTAQPSFPTSSKPVFNTEGKLVFSKFDFSASGNSEKPKTDLKGKNYKRLLEKLEKRKKRADVVREKSTEAAERLEGKEVWKKAQMKAEGELVKDDEKLLRKAVKRKEKDKAKKKKVWTARINSVEQGKKKRDDKRKQNLQSRVNQKKEKKKKKFVKKGRIIPGF